jgi:S-formylglutathione hydrolase FrmB
VSGWFPPATVVLAVLCLLACVPWEARARWRVIRNASVAATLVTAGAVVTVHAFGWLSWPVPWTFDLWVGTVVLALALGVAVWRYVRWRRLVPVLAVGATALMAATLINANYGYFPSTTALFDPPASRTTVAALSIQRSEHHALASGEVVPVDIPPVHSHFHARTAYVWVPPAYTADPTLSLPVLELLAGTPGTTLDWLRAGRAATTADAYAKEHHGVAPLLVMPDDNGALTSDTECVNGPAGQAETYLTEDVPDYLREVFHAATGPRSLAVAGLSEGGTCAVMLALRHGAEYSAFGDYSGLTAPTSANVVAPVLTTRTLFGGSTVQYDQHDPVLLLSHAHDPRLAGWFESGGADLKSVQAQQTLSAFARRAGIDTVAVTVPGQGHDFGLWARAFQQSLPFLAHSLALDLAA